MDLTPKFGVNFGLNLLLMLVLSPSYLPAMLDVELRQYAVAVDCTLHHLETQKLRLFIYLFIYGSSVDCRRVDTNVSTHSPAHFRQSRPPIPPVDFPRPAQNRPHGLWKGLQSTARNRIYTAERVV